MKKYTLTIISILVVVLGAWALWPKSDQSPQSASDTSTPIATAKYFCDGDKSITASYYQGPTAPTPKPGEPPVPTGSVEVAFDGGAVQTLQQTLSASGVRYANADESLVFWNKGNEALVMRNNEMDLSYTNCVAPQQ